MSGILAVVLDAEHQVVSVESESRHLIGTKVVVVMPPGSEAERSIFRVSGSERPIADIYHNEELVERRNRVGGELARLMYEASMVIKSEKWGKTEVEAFLQRLADGVAELKRGLKEDFDPADPMRQWAAWFEHQNALAAQPKTVIAAE
jgi:hypothetical protein